MRAGDQYPPSGAKGRFQANLRAIETARLLDEEGRRPTRDEQEALAAWSSWGAIPDVFDDRKPDWAQEREQLKAVLSDEDYRAAGETILNAHYTDPALITAMWQSLTDLGFSGGQVIEPGSGSGNFIGAAPAGMSITGVEIDPITSSIARHLYPDADIQTESFAETRVRPDSFDAAIGNVPFGRTRLLDPVWNPGQRFNIHEHFIRKSLGGASWWGSDGRGHVCVNQRPAQPRTAR